MDDSNVSAIRPAPRKDVRVLKNYMEIVPGQASSRIGIDPAGVYESFKRHFPDWPKTIKGQLAVYLDGAVHEIGCANHLFGWMQSRGATIDWHGEISTAITKAEFMAYVQFEAERYDSATKLPHFPRVPGVLYLEGAPVPVANGALDELLAFFLPATDMDRDLLKAAFLTPFWGGPGGQRPAFVLTGKESDEKGGRGVGKTTVVDVLAALSGGFIEMSLGTAIDDFKKRLLTSSGERVIRLDNVKAAKLSSADLEALITAPYVSGHLMYHGEGKVPNLFTYFITFNDVSFSRDMAQRAIPIVLGRPDYDDEWILRVLTFVADANDRILSDIAAIFARTPAVIPPKFRFAMWAKDVLGRVSSDPGIAEKILSAQKEVDDDENQAELFDEVICGNIRRYFIPGYGLHGRAADVEMGAAFVINKNLINQWLRDALKLPLHSSEKMARLIKAARVAGIKGETKRAGLRCYLYWRAKEKPENGYLVLDNHTVDRNLSHVKFRDE